VIYVTVGGHPQDFSRLLHAVDEIAPRFDEKFIVQRGVSQYVPRNAERFDYIGFREADDLIRQARLVISHAGTGTIMRARKYGVPVIIVPRRKKYNEHYNDHQLEICEALLREPREHIHVLFELAQLEAAIRKALAAAGAAPAREDGGRRIIEAIRRHCGVPKILMVNPMDDTYGSTHRIRIFYEGLSRSGWAVDYVESNPGAYPATAAVTQPNNTFGFLRGTLGRFLMALTRRYDILYIQTLTPLTIPAVLVAKLRRKRIIVDWDDLSWVLQKNRLRAILVRFCEHAFVSLPDVVLVPNRYLGEYGTDRGAKKMIFAPHGVDFERFDPSRYEAGTIRRELGLADGPVLGFLASFTTGGVGDLDLICAAVKRVMERRRNVTFLVIGGGPLYDDYVRKVERWGMPRDRMRFTGLLRQSEIPRYLSAVDIALILMRDNLQNRMKTSLKVGEYIAMNKTVVGHLTGQTRDDFASYCTLSEPDPEAFAARIEEVLDRPAPRRDGREALMREYTWDRSIRAADAALRTVGER
jgi:UDP-N-acetylglucosamine transferase subunit ALG13/glycosyltransferase involved in cell wall biosynthesis